MDALGTVRRHFAEGVCAGLRYSEALTNAFASVDRATYLLPPPWAVIDNGPGRAGKIRTTSNPRDLYHDRLVQLDPSRRINNGQPSLWAAAFDRLLRHNPTNVLHLGCGSGYYTAVLAALLPEAELRFADLNAPLQQHAERALADKPRVQPDTGATPCDAIVCSFGRSVIDAPLLSRWRDGGVLLTPLADASGRGFFIELCRSGDVVDIRALFPCLFILDDTQTDFPDRVVWQDAVTASVPRAGPLDLAPLFAP